MTSTHPEIHGDCDPRFQAVRDALANNFATHDELGSAVTVYHEGQKVVDLWGGHMDAARSKPWREDTLCIMYSIAKSICATSVHILADRGLVDLEAPVADYWPEFAQNGKEGVLVRHIISHNCGVCFADATEAGDVYNYDRMIAALEVQAPAWPAGSRGAYNTVNIGFLAGEVVRRVTGTPIPQFVQENICGPLGVDYQIGVREEDLDRVADLQPNPAGSAMAAQAAAGETPLSRAWRPNPKPMNTDVQNSREFRTAGIPSFGGFGEARAMARIYAMLANGGEIDGVRILSPEAVARATVTQWTEEADGMTGRPMRYAMGYAKNPPGAAIMGPNENAFGHLGSGGARALADPDRNLALCFVSDLHSEGFGVGVRTEAIVDAAFAAL
ncbi:MAG: beta-lactamase family protein [Rhodospirillaceae bacterium]|jgi:CubicO group peptidase (beta-lactamase class C family)|nr:beta-lactamase family protein [Rhodospirillaceae bacterium]MBT3808475.1 beta-lactamase family protein [Rhodospirillaceae bacterium]MBT3931568.1 beta-lactamase family protein [Rhodospirillaceae bacterium]MBT4773296.1 beta-lactamase family protein [Rhodospirillaceae bacterium]MBT5769927.1 beta-lactamase family protein [Rhodospirillaceae bacterium]